MTRVMSWSAMLVLLPAAILRFSSGYQVLLQFLVCAAAIRVGWEAYRGRQYLSVVAFAAIAVLFNPIQPIELSNGYVVWFNVACIAAFGIYLARLKSRPALSDNVGF